MRFPEKRQHVVLAQRVELDVLYHYHLPVVLLKKCRAQNGFGVFLVTLCQELECLANAPRGLEQTFAMRVFARKRKHGNYVFAYLPGQRLVWSKIFLSHCFTFMCSSRTTYVSPTRSGKTSISSPLHAAASSCVRKSPTRTLMKGGVEMT